MRARGVIWLGPFFLVGVLAMQWLPALPSRGWLVAAAVGAALVAWRFPSARGAMVIVFGMAWAGWCGSRAMEARLPRELEGSDIVVVGTIAGLTQVRDEATRFELKVERASLGDNPIALAGSLRLAWYAAGTRSVPKLESCSRWRLLPKLPT